uniref:Homing endonuclease LAGLIDADG domain-containing protein n=1 Tax=Ulva rigida TaxID=75689 RepID=A0A8F0HZQ7_9CHLO|nr:hypothetical protein [Ulva rigida]
MDDGSLKSKQSKGVILNTHNFAIKEIETLCLILNDKFKLQCKPRKQKHLVNNETCIYYQIYISGHSYDILRKLIFDYLLPEMYYKFPKPRSIKKKKTNTIAQKVTEVCKGSLKLDGNQL